MALRPLELKAKNGTVLLGFLCVFPSLAQSVWSGSNDEKGKCLNISKGPMALCLCLAAGALWIHPWVDIWVGLASCVLWRKWFPQKNQRLWVLLRCSGQVPQVQESWNVWARKDGNVYHFLYAHPSSPCFNSEDMRHRECNKEKWGWPHQEHTSTNCKLRLQSDDPILSRERP